MLPVRTLLAAIVVSAWTAVGTQALELGDPAPPLQVSEWIKGDPVKLKESGDKNVYVIEFWATWCGPCVATIPHLTELQKRWKDKGVAIVALTDEPAARIRSFVRGRGQNIGYTVGIDEDGRTYEAYMRPFKVQGIPHAFIVDKAGKLVWHGHPAVQMERTVERILSGTYDIQAAKNAAKARKRIDEYFGLVSTRGRRVFGLFGRSTAPPADVEKAAAIGKEILELGAADAHLMNEFSWRILTDEGIKPRDLDLALKAGKAAYDACEGKDPAIVDTYARALFDTGEHGRAIEYQKKAVELCDDKELIQHLKATLREYESRVSKAQ